MKGKVLGAILLIAGTTIGAAMLALPVSTGRSGFFPSLFAFVGIWGYLYISALYILEVCLSLPKDSNLVSMAEHTLGTFGKWAASLAYLFLLYALNTAYMAATMSLFQDTIFQLSGWMAPKAVCIIPQLCIFFTLLHIGISFIDTINRIGMVGLFSCFIILLFLSIPYIQGSNVFVSEWKFLFPSLAVVLTAFGFHVILPSLVSYLDGNVKSLKKAITIGTLIPLFAYILWQLVVLGIVPLQGKWSIQTAFETGQTGSQLLGFVVQNTWLTGVDEIFAICAIITSFLGVSVSLFDFLKDGLKVQKKYRNTLLVGVLAFLPPVYFALSYKRVFLSALEYAGTFGVVVLLALIPAMMVWRKRYVLRLSSSYKAPGGKLSLVLFMAVSLLFICFELI